MKVAIVGVGYVGLVSGLVLAERGHEVLLVDVDPARVEALARAEAPFRDPGVSELLRALQPTGRLRFASTFEGIAACELAMLCVPTPSAADGTFALDALADATARIVEALRRGPYALGAVFVRSTVLPGTTRALVAAALPADVAAGMLPEFLREGSALADARRPDRIVVGADAPALHALARELHRDVPAPVFATTIETAELIKLGNNALLSLCISFSNELARVAERVEGVDAFAVLEGVQLDRRLHGAGIVEYLRPGVGFGGSCLGKDLRALSAFAGARGEPAAILGAVARVNLEQPLRFVARVEEACAGLAGRRVLVLGLAFKPGTDDVRDSIAFPIVAELRRRGAEVVAHDPAAASRFVEALRAAEPPALVEDFLAALDAHDVVVLLTAWPDYLDALPARLAERTTPLVFADGRGALRGVPRSPLVTYVGVGSGTTHAEPPDDRALLA